MGNKKKEQKGKPLADRLRGASLMLGGREVVSLTLRTSCRSLTASTSVGVFSERRAWRRGEKPHRT